jgi:dihydroorotate dehydrogenase (fumarate)
MAELRTRYMGIDLPNPILVGACSLSKQVDSIRQMEAAGAGGLVIKSLFEEQVQLEQGKFEDERSRFDELYGEAVNLFPKTPHAGPKEHLFWIGETRKAVKMPLFASLNAVNPETWVEWSRRLQDTGVDGLELNFYSLPLDPALASSEIEKRELDAFAKVRAAVKIPIAVKLHPYYTNMLGVAEAFSKAGANALVLFNRLFQPDVSLETESERAVLTLSNSADSQLALRWMALLHGRVKSDLVASTGIMTGRDALKMVLGGATAVQVVSTLYRNRISHIAEMLSEMRTWMDGKRYTKLEDFRGKASKQRVKDPWAYERGQYIKALLGFD